MRATPSLRERPSVTGPTPHSRPTGSGARNAATPPGGTSTSPSGLPRSVAIFAASFTSATPAEHGEPALRAHRALHRARRWRAPAPWSARLAVTSRNASSSESGSTSGVYRR